MRDLEFGIEVLGGWENFFSNGYDAVSFFFVLSGFVLTYVYGGESESQSLRTGQRKFWHARFARIYPAYFLALLIALPAFVYSMAISKLISFSEFFTALLLVPTLCQAWLPSAATAWNMPAWSLSVEAFFYLLFPFLIRRLQAVTPGALFSISLVTVVLVSVCRMWLASSPDLMWCPDIRNNFVSYFPPLFLPHFIFGMALSRCFSASRGRLSMGLSLLAVPSGVLLVLLFGMRSILPVWAVSDAVLVPLFGAVIFGAAQAKGLLASLLSFEPLVQLGEASYALYILYILHMPLAFWYRWGALKFSGDPFDHRLGVAFFGALSVAFSYVVFIWFERPARRWLTNRPVTGFR